MRRSAFAFAAIALLVAAPAVAQDQRIVTRFYDPAKIVTLAMRAGIQSTVQFADDERIENVALGDSADWQVTPNKRASLLFVKPMKAPARTNMTVVTDRRTYLFDLSTSARGAGVYMLRFTYPKPPAAPVLAAAPQEAAIAAAVAKAEADQAATQATPADLNFAWLSAGAKQLFPQRAFDDGHAVWLSWPKDVILPAILVREPGGTEGPVNYTVRGDYVVVDGVPAQLVLRSGKQMATLTPDPHAVRVAPPPAASTATAPTVTTPTATAPSATGGAPLPRPALAAAIPSRPFSHVADGHP